MDVSNGQVVVEGCGTIQPTNETTTISGFLTDNLHCREAVLNLGTTVAQSCDTTMSSIAFDGTVDGHVAGTVCDGAVIVNTDTCGIFFSDVDDTIGNQVLDYTC